MSEQGAATEAASTETVTTETEAAPEISLEEALTGAAETETKTDLVSKETETETKVEESKPDSAESKKTDKELAKDEMVPLKGLTEERRKRQEAESREQGLLGRITQLEGTKQPEKKEPVPVPDPIDDPEGFAKHFESRLSTQQSSFESRLLNERVKTSSASTQREMGAEKFFEMSGVFTQLVKADPSLLNKMLDNAEPYQFAKQTVDQYLQYKDMENIEDVKSKMEAELRTKIEAEILEKHGIKAEAETKSDDATATPSLAGKTDVGAGTASTNVDIALDDILKPY